MSFEQIITNFRLYKNYNLINSAKMILFLATQILQFNL